MYTYTYTVYITITTNTMDGVINKIQTLCTPAFIFFILSMLSIFIMLFDNIENTHSYCFGNVSCNVANTSILFIIKILFVVFWTWFLNAICSRGYANVAWFILLFPYILLFGILLFTASEIINTNKIKNNQKNKCNNNLYNNNRLK